MFQHEIEKADSLSQSLEPIPTDLEDWNCTGVFHWPTGCFSSDCSLLFVAACIYSEFHYNFFLFQEADGIFQHKIIA